MLIRRCSFLLVVIVSVTVAAQVAPKKTINRAADIPRFTYPVSGRVEGLLKSDEEFRPFAAQVRKNIESVLAEYDIAESATRRQLLHTLVALDILEGKEAQATQRLDQIRALEDKPAQKYTSELNWRAVLDARRISRDRASGAYRRAFQDSLRRALDGMPFAVVQNEIKSAKARAEIVTEALVLGQAAAVMDPVIKKSGTLSSEFAHRLPGMRVAIVEDVPMRDVEAETYGAYLAAHKIEKPDIWAARDATLAPAKPYSVTPVAVWDSGVDLAIFSTQVAQEAGQPAVLAYDLQWRPTTGELFALSPEQKAKLPENMKRLKGFLDMQANLDTPEATAVKKEIAQLKPEQVRPFIEQVIATSMYAHGTHVAGILLAGNPYARLVTGRMTFDYKMIPDPCPSRELSQRTAEAPRQYVAFFKRNQVRVVNMSWGTNVAEYERALELCGIGANTEERKKTARELFEIDKKGLYDAIASTPEILFVAAAGNSNNDASFNEDVPASFGLANVLAVGAVDQAGDEAPFTSYGPTVVAHANGYEVESYVPGGARMRLSGTSMASPNTANLAAKILAINSRLTPAQVIEIIRRTEDKTADGRRFLINPKKAIEQAATSH